LHARIALAAAWLLVFAAIACAAAEVAPADRLQAAEGLFVLGTEQGVNRGPARLCFEGAGKGYGQLAREFDRPALYLNSGNAYVLADDLPHAILAYRRGLRLHPLSGDLWGNLEATRDQVGYSDGASRHRPPGDDWPPWAPRPSPEQLLTAALALHAAAWLAVFAWLVVRRRWVGVTSLALFVTAALAAGGWGYLQWRIAEDQEPLAVVAVNGATLRRGNGPLYPRHPDLPRVNRGMEAALVHERGGWVQLRFPGGETGWLPREAVVME
jgi:hypothetical protein